jgi:K+-sensing histidine kinase KdpD
MNAFACKRNASNYESELMERLSHELRTSLTGVVGYSEFVESTSTEPMINFTAKIIRESSQGLVRTSNSYFDLHRLEKGQVQLECSSFSMSELVRDVVRSSQKYAQEQGVHLVYTCSNDTFVLNMVADEKRVRQVVDALVFGAVQSAGKGKSIHVDVSLVDEMRCLKLMIISSDAVCDAASIGLLKEFWSSDRYKFRLQEGPGVELALAKAMIYLLQGKAEYQNQPHEFPRLVVLLPMHFNQDKADA